jgi:hypothetical protein
LFINLASVPGRQLVNSPTAAILGRCTLLLDNSLVMKNLAFLFLVLFVSNNIYSQKKLDLLIYPLEDRVALKTFWSNFQIAINTNNKQKLAKLIKFPFVCEQRFFDTLDKNDTATIIVSKKQFDLNFYRFFYVNNLIELIKNNIDLDKIFNHYSDYSINDYNKHKYFFGYKSMESTVDNSREIKCFIIEKIDSQFKITTLELFKFHRKGLTPF